jgi:hypothetical protein
MSGRRLNEMQEDERQHAYECACDARDQLDAAIIMLSLHDSKIIIRPHRYDQLLRIKAALDNWIGNELQDAAEEGQTLREIPVVLLEDADNTDQP